MMASPPIRGAVSLPDRGRTPVWEIAMRLTAATVAIAGLLMLVSSTSQSAPAPAPLAPLSRDMQAAGEQLLAGGNAAEAQGYFESAVVADPRNADAYLGLGRTARAQHRPGQALAAFRAAAALAPGSRAALLGQGLALADRGALDRARAQIAALRTACGNGSCAEAEQLSAALGTAGRTALAPAEVMPRPVVEPAGASPN